MALTTPCTIWDGELCGFSGCGNQCHICNILGHIETLTRTIKTTNVMSKSNRIWVFVAKGCRSMVETRVIPMWHVCVSHPLSHVHRRCACEQCWLKLCRKLPFFFNYGDKNRLKQWEYDWFSRCAVSLLPAWHLLTSHLLLLISHSICSSPHICRTSIGSVKVAVLILCPTALFSPSVKTDGETLSAPSKPC